jgi:hypothetical protein
MATGDGEITAGAVDLDARCFVRQSVIDLTEREEADTLPARAYLGVRLSVADDLCGDVRQAVGIADAVVEIYARDVIIAVKDQADAGESVPLHASPRHTQRRPRRWDVDGRIAPGSRIKRWLRPPAIFPAIIPRDPSFFVA